MKIRTYYRVAFIGRGFPAFLQNMTFVYRGKGFEKLTDFQARILDQFPNAELMRTMDAPTDEEKEGAQPRVQIIKVIQGQGSNSVEGIFDQQSIFS